MKAQFAIVGLLGLVAAAPGCADNQPAQVIVDSVAYTPDGTLVVLTNDGMFLFDPSPSAPQRGHIALGWLPASQEANQYKYSLSADGTVAAVAYSSGTSTTAPIVLDLYRVPTGEVLNSFKVASPAPGSVGSQMVAVALSPHGDRVAAISLNGSQTKLTMIDAAAGAVAWTATNGDVTLPGWSPDGATLYATGGSATGSVLEAYDARDGLKWSQPLPYFVGPIAVTADGTKLAGVASESPCTTSTCLVQYSLWSAADGTVGAQQALPPNIVPYPGAYGGVGNGAFSCSATDDICAIQLEDNRGPPYLYTVRVYRTDGTDVLSLPLRSFVASVALSPDGQFVAVSAGSPSWGGGVNAAEVYRISDGTLVASHSFQKMP